jgi:hypothetical protein
MIIVRLFGGLGNQMFQYAVGRALAYRIDTELKLDISDYNGNPLRQYNLFPFNIIENFATMSDLDRVRKSFFAGVKSPIRLLKETLNRDIPIISIKERIIDFDLEILHLPDNVYLKGYWQSEKYFKDIEKIIRIEFGFKAIPDPLNKKIGQQIADGESVSIHVRRGDYVSNPQTLQVHGVCDVRYYQKAINKMCNKIDTPHFYVFSDDPMWAKANMSADAPIDFLTHNDTLKNYEDLRLMTLCKHHIIANSSFGWWGAWLNPNKEKIVIAPKKWFRTTTFKLDDRFPSEWYLI